MNSLATPVKELEVEPRDPEMRPAQATVGRSPQQRGTGPKKPKKPKPEKPKKTTTLPFGKIALVVGAAVWTLASGIIGAVAKDQVIDRWFPPTEQATIQDVAVQKATFGNYLDGIGRPRSGYETSRLNESGLAVYSSVKTSGYKGDRLRITGGVLDQTKGGAELTDLGLRVYAFNLTPRSGKDDVRTTNIWVPLPQTAGTYAVVERLHKGEDFLDRETSSDLEVDANGRVKIVKPKEQPAASAG